MAFLVTSGGNRLQLCEPDKVVDDNNRSHVTGPHPFSMAVAAGSVTKEFSRLLMLPGDQHLSVKRASRALLFSLVSKSRATFLFLCEMVTFNPCEVVLTDSAIVMEMPLLFDQ